MKIEEAKVICPHFSPITVDGKTKCQFVDPTKLCTLPSHFDCELNRYRNGGGKVFTSVSNIQEWMRCQRAWAFHYVYNLKPPTESQAKLAGGAFATCRAKIDAGKRYEIPSGLNAYEIAKLQVVLDAYKGLDKLADENEKYIETHMGNGLWLRGYLDGLKGDTIYEWKYTSDASNFDRMKISMQAASYLAALPSVTNFMLCVAVKPEVAPCESLEAYAARKHENLFKFTNYLRSEFDIAGTLAYMARIHDQQTCAKLDKRFEYNHLNCRWCEWFNYCETHPTIGCNQQSCSYQRYCEVLRCG